MEELTSTLEQATEGIAPDYFYLNLDGGDPVYRERVYCYELYHQMRMRWPAQTPFYLNGEVDKARHPKMIHLRDRFPKPDLLVHRPGYMEGNFAVIEVKCDRAGKAGITKDLETLSFFTKEFGYQRAIYLIYGDVALDTLEQIQEIAQKIEDLGPIEYWAHGTPHTAAGKRPADAVVGNRQLSACVLGLPYDRLGVGSGHRSVRHRAGKAVHDYHANNDEAHADHGGGIELLALDQPRDSRDQHYAQACPNRVGNSGGDGP